MVPLPSYGAQLMVGGGSWGGRPAPIELENMINLKNMSSWLPRDGRWYGTRWGLALDMFGTRHIF